MGDVTIVRRNQFIGQNVCNSDVAICVIKEKDLEKNREKKKDCIVEHSEPLSSPMYSF